jgi:hypothetical protein
MSIPGPRLIGIQVTLSMFQYLEQLNDLGLIEGAIGKMDVTAAAKPLIDALHHVLAGGSATVTITTAGNAQKVADLDKTLQQATADGNTVNGAAGFYLTASP